MRKTVEVEAKICDWCGADGAYYACLGTCGREACYKCKEVQGIEYPHVVYFNGGSDGFYCAACDAKATDELHAAYQRVAALRREEAGFYTVFKPNAEAAQAMVEKLRKERGLK